MSRRHRRPAGHEGARAVPFPGPPPTRTPRGATSRPQPLVAVVVAVAALAGCLVATELALRALSAHALLVLDVEMWRYARRVKAPSAAPGLIEVHRTDARARLMGVEVRTDEHGFRRPAAAIEATRRPDDRRVAVIGDSLSFGWGVAEDETVAARLESALRDRCPEAPATVWNAGVGNSNTAMQLARYDLVVSPLRPQWVVLGYFINDAEPDAETTSHPLIWRSALANLLVTRLAQGRHGDLRDYREYYAELYDEDPPGWRATRRALGELGRRLSDDGVAATLLLLPEMHHPRGHGPFAEIYAEVAALGQAAGFEVIDTAPGFPPGPGERFWVTPRDAHPDGAAHAIFAEALLASRYACPGAAPEIEGPLAAGQLSRPSAAPDRRRSP